MPFDLRSTEKLLEGLVVLFYVAIGLALLATLMGSPGWGFLFLLLGAAGLVARTGLEIQQRQPSRPSQSPPPPPTARFAPRAAPSGPSRSTPRGRSSVG